MSSPSDPEQAAVGAINPFAGGFRFQSSQPHLKRFIMFDHSNGKGRVFFHPAIAQELFGSAQTRARGSKISIPNQEVKTECSASSLAAYRQMVEGAFTSLQGLRASRQNDVLLPKADSLTPGLPVSSQKPRVPETTAMLDKRSWTLDAQHVPWPPVASETLVCEEKPKVLAILPSVDTIQDCTHHISFGCDPNSNRSELNGLKRSEVAAPSELLHENTEDLDALLSSDEDDDDVQSTGHSPDESLGKGGCEDGDEEEVEQNPFKRKKTFDEYELELSTKVVGVPSVFSSKANCGIAHDNAQSSRRQKIKKTVKALQRMIPGGSVLDTAFVLDRTIMYVKTLRDRVNQLEASRLQSQFCDPHSW